MRILWVEDNDQLPKQLIQQWFGEFAAQHQIERHNGFSGAYRCIETQTRNYDCVILDINLENSAFNPEEFKDSGIVWPEAGAEKDKSFLREAGFHLYIGLLYKGFPTERIVFLTGNASEHDNSRAELISQFKQAFSGEDETAYRNCAHKINENLPKPLRTEFENLLKNSGFDALYAWLEQWAIPPAIPGEPSNTNTYKELKDRFYNARMVLPPPIEKSQHHTAAVLQDWLRRHCSPTSGQRDEFDYLTLRRGILDVIAEIAKDRTIQFTPDFQNDLDKEAFLAGLEWQVRDFALPSDDYEKSYLALCDYLSKPFERFDGRQLSQSRDLKLPLYYLRNWIAHGLVSGSETKITAQAAGIAFLLAMRHFFGIEKYGFQKELQRLFARPITDPQKWKQACIGIGRKHGVRNSDDALKEIKDFGFKNTSDWDKQDFIQHFYAAYLLCLQQADGSVANAPLNPWVTGEIS